MDIPCDQPFHHTLAKRYRVLAGPFTPGEAGLIAGLLEHLKATGARVTTVGYSHGVEVWRLRSERETLEETAARLKSFRKRR